MIMVLKNVSVVERLERRDCDQHSLSLKPTRPVLLYSLKRHFTALSSA